MINLLTSGDLGALFFDRISQSSTLLPRTYGLIRPLFFAYNLTRNGALTIHQGGEGEAGSWHEAQTICGLLSAFFGAFA